MLEVKRINWIDFLRGVAILFVVLGHTSVPFMKYIYGFHMPLFYIISGILYKYKDNMSDKDYIKSIAQKYIKPYFYFTFINLLICTCTDIILDKSNIFTLLKKTYKYIIGILYSRGTTEFMPNCSPLWFLTSMFCLLVIFRLIEKLHILTLKYIVIILLPCISVSLDVLNVPKLFWNIDTAMMAVLFFNIGIIASGNKTAKINNSKLIFYLLLFIIGMICIKYNPIEAVNFDDNSYGNPLLMLIGSSSISLIIITVCYMLRNRMNNFISRYIMWLGKHTMFIMGFDYFSASCAYKIFSTEQWGACLWQR